MTTNSDIQPVSERIDLRATLETLKATAAAQVARYPQYKNHFASYRLARVKRDITTKAGLAFVRGEYVIAVKAPAFVHLGVTELGPRVTAWSRRNQIDTSVRDADLEWLEV